MRVQVEVTGAQEGLLKEASVSWSALDKKGLRGIPDRGYRRRAAQQHEGVHRECPAPARGRGRGEGRRGGRLEATEALLPLGL